MPRKNLIIVLVAGLLFLFCYAQVSQISTARHLGAVLELIQKKGLHPQEENSLFTTAASAMAEAHDPHSSYIPPASKDRYIGILDQELSGIGISVRRDPATGDLLVQTPIIGQPHPAYDAGMRSGDKIISVAGKSVAGKSLGEVTKWIQGKEGTEVEITVQPAQGDQEVALFVKRARIAVDSVLGAFRNHDTSWNFLLPNAPEIAYIHVTDFGDRTSEELRRAIAEIKTNESLSGIIIDLRDNTGGYLSAAVDVSDLFLEGGTIVTTRGRGGAIRETFDAQNDTAVRELPVVILINGETASASEIFAASLQDHKRATVVGSRSFGKGSVQQIIPLPDGGMLKLTTATYHRPSGVNIHREPHMDKDATWGVKPDSGHAVRLSEDEDRERLRRRIDQIAEPRSASQAVELPFADPVLKAALEILREKNSESPKLPQS